MFGCTRHRTLCRDSQDYGRNGKHLFPMSDAFHAQASRIDISPGSFYRRIKNSSRAHAILHFFQGKPAIERDSVDTSGRRERPQAVTRHLFGPLAQLQEQQQQLSCRPSPQTATASIFAPRTEDMNKGFLTFSEDQPGLTSTCFFCNKKRTKAIRSGSFNDVQSLSKGCFSRTNRSITLPFAFQC